MRKLIIGTRGSKLALYQSKLVKDLLLQYDPDLEIELKIIKTQGDKFLNLALDASGDKGLFTKEIEHELISGQIDMAVHSLKDLPVDMTEGTLLGAILKREDPRDALLGAYTIDTLPQNAKIGTSSKRRAKQIQSLRPDLEVLPIRGNVETRISKMKGGEYDAIIMAVAGLKRLSLDGEIKQIFSAREICPAPGQAAIAVQIRLSDNELYKTLQQSIHDPIAEQETKLERRLLQSIGGGCALPFGCCVQMLEEKLWINLFFSKDERELRLNRCTEPGEQDALINALAHQIQTL